jgi:hypothetical protein
MLQMHKLFVAVALWLVSGVLVASADETTPSVDLVAMVVLGMEDGAAVGLAGPAQPMLVHRTGPGAFASDAFSFSIVEKSNCLFDIGFAQGGKAGGGLELDARRLTAIAYEKTGETPPLFSYRITLSGGDKLVQNIAPDGTLSHATTDTTLNTTLSAERMQQAVAALQALCPAT